MNRISFCILIFQLYGYPGAFTFCVLLHTYIRTSEIRVMHPCISLILAAVRLKPRITVDMADHPAGIHLESRRDCLGMKLSARYCGEAVVHALEYLIAYEACTKSLRTVELEQVCLRLRVSVRKISGPVTSVIQHLSKHHVRLRRNIMVKDGIHTALCHVAELPYA